MSDHDDRGESGPESTEPEAFEEDVEEQSDSRDSLPESEDEPNSDSDSGSELELDDVDVKDLLRQALAPPKGAVKSIAPGVQRKIREESKGRFFADGWSTTSAPIATFLVTSVVMLAIVVLAYVLMAPLGIQLP